MTPFLISVPQSAALRGGVSDLLAVPAAVPCPGQCEGGIVHHWYEPWQATKERPCVICGGKGTQRFSPSVGDPLDVVAVGPLPKSGRLSDNAYIDWDGATPDENTFVLVVESDHEFLPVDGAPDDNECTYREDGTDATYCGLTVAEHMRYLPLVPGEVTRLRVTEGPLTLIEIDKGPSGGRFVKFKANESTSFMPGVEEVFAATVFDPSAWAPGALVVRVEVEP